MSAIAASAPQVQFVPKDGNSYFYESFSCQQAVTNGYGGIQFTIQGPAGGSVALELQSVSNCSSGSTTNYTSSYNIVDKLSGQLQTVTLPLVGFDNNPNYDAIIGLVWSSFSQTGVQWSIGNISFVCGTVSVPPTTTSTSMLPPHPQRMRAS